VVPYERSSRLLAPARNPGTPGRCRIATCGRLFEGTDEISLGQTYPNGSAPDLIRHTVHPRRAEAKLGPRNVAELLAPATKTVNFWQCRFQTEAAMDNEARMIIQPRAHRTHDPCDEPR
jgi:hypothetical protein